MQPYSAEHAVGVITSAVMITVLVAIGRRARCTGSDAEARVRQAWIGWVVVVQLTAQIQANLPGSFDLARTLPLHVCDIVPWLGLAALQNASRWPRALAYFWGIGLSVWAFVMPILDAPAWGFEYWLFWLGHAQIIGTAVYLLAVARYRPCGGDGWRALVATVVYTAVVAPIDVWLAADYGYLGERSAAGELGPWPERIGVLLVGEGMIFVALMIPWWIAARFRPNATAASDR